MINSKLSKHNIQTIVVNKLNYSYIEKGKGPVIFLLHGFPDTAGTWDSIIDSLSKKFRCIAPFLRGYYPTDIPRNNDFSVAAIAKDIHFIAKKLCIEQYSVVGHDWGASIAYALANIYPKEVDKICSIGMPHPKFLKPSIQLLYRARHILTFMNVTKAEKKIQENDYAYVEKLYKRWSPNWKQYNLNLARLIFCFNKPNRIQAALFYYKEIGNTHPDLIRIYKIIPQKKCLVLVGKKDGVIDFKQINQMKQYSVFDIKEHSTAGHFLHQEDELFCLNQIINFFQN